MTARAAVAAAAVVFGAVVLGGPAAADGDTPPATLVSGEPARGAALDPVFGLFKIQRMSCKFSEEKHVALLARPLRSTGTIHFERDRGIARITITPKLQHVVLTTTSLRIRTAKRTEEIPLDKSRDLKAFAMVFPTLLRGQRAELERSFEIGLYGSAGDWWALAFTPKADSLRKLVRRVVVIGRAGKLVAVQVSEASGDTTDMRLTDVLTNGAVPDTEIATAFGAP